jgi:hypothetical protein
MMMRGRNSRLEGRRGQDEVMNLYIMICTVRSFGGHIWASGKISCRNDLGIGVHDFVSYASLAKGVDSIPWSQDWSLSHRKYL